MVAASDASFDSMIRYLSYLTFVQKVLDRYDNDNLKRKIMECYGKGRRLGDRIIDMYLEYLPDKQ